MYQSFCWLWFTIWRSRWIIISIAVWIISYRTFRKRSFVWFILWLVCRFVLLSLIICSIVGFVLIIFLIIRSIWKVISWFIRRSLIIIFISTNILWKFSTIVSVSICSLICKTRFNIIFQFIQKSIKILS